MSCTPGNLQVAMDEATNCVKRQKTCAAKSELAIDRMIEMVERGLQCGAAGPPEDVLAQLHRSIEDAGLFKDINSSTKEFHTSVAKLGKALDKTFDMNADLCRALRPTAPAPGFDAAAADAHTCLLSRVLAEHFYREGRFALGDALAAEAGLMDAEALRAPYASMHTVLEQIRSHNLAPALEWAVQQRPALSPDGGPSPFEFRLHGLNFTHLLQTQGKMAALLYAKRHFAPHASRHMADIQRLMGCLVFADRDRQQQQQMQQEQQQDGTDAGASGADVPPITGGGGGGDAGSGMASHPYDDLLSPSQWGAAAREFAKQACSLMGQASESPLTMVVAAGSVALPAILKMAAVMERNAQDMRAVDQLPVEIQLGPEFVFRSIFACPVSRDMSTPDNPPMLLPCGHVLCEQSVAKLAKSRSRAFKCPYCPMEARLDALRPLTFPHAS
ncbi:Protein RMD5 A [Tetrabaena socialis]|uniref:Protein RMD5 A n=1 Tax=Tetrabaena socialis TaxID=47790 RepID=A0A2J8AHR5_9CHLO|nr:Protein RMD5 A [Tetrabaena socialis]|eukprot:PNH12058.1 Protein RMD5 A [Tetrabaena socialis]